MSLIQAMEKVRENIAGTYDGPAGEITLPTPTELPASLSPDELRECLRRRYDKLKALEVEYTFNNQVFGGEDRIVPCGRLHFAFSAEKRFKAQSSPCRDGEFVYPHGVWAWDGKVQQTYESESQDAFLDGEQKAWTNCDFYLRTAGIPIGSLEDELANSTKACRPPPWIHRIMGSTDRWRVQSQLELVDGAHCHVVQLGYRHKIWLDPVIDFAIRFRESYSRRHVLSNWRIIGRYAYRDFRCFADDIWLPWRLESVQYEPNPAAIRKDEQRTRYCIDEAQKLAVNAEVPDSLFSLQFPPGTVVRDKANRKFYRLGDHGEEIKMGEWE